MAVDPSKLKKFGRRGLGLPPTDGSPGIEESTANRAQASAPSPKGMRGHLPPPRWSQRPPRQLLAGILRLRLIPWSAGCLLQRRAPGESSKLFSGAIASRRPMPSHGFRSLRGSLDPRRSVLRMRAITYAGGTKTSLTRRSPPI